jgi:hypothetical protein
MNRISDLFIEKVAAYNGEPILINDWCHFVTFDAMGDIAFGKTYGQLESGKKHQAIALIHQWLGFSVYAIQVPWLSVLLQNTPGVEDPTTVLRRFSESCLEERKKVSWLSHHGLDRKENQRIQ